MIAVAMLLLCVVAAPLYADPNDIVIDNTTTASIRGATSLTFSFTVGTGSNRYMLVEVATGNGRDVSSITYGGTAMSRFASEITPGTKDRVVMYEMINPPSGTANVVVTLAAGGGVNMCAGAISFANVHQTTPRRATAIANSLGLPGDKGTTMSVTVTSVARDAVVDAAISSTGTTVQTAAADQTLQWNIDSNSGAGGGGETNLGCSVKYASTTSTTMTWTLSQQDKWAIIATSIEPAITPTEVNLLTIGAQQDKEKVVLSWKTSYELRNLGFNVYRQVSGAALEKINPYLIAGTALQHAAKPVRAPTSYRWRDSYEGAGFVQYYLEDIDVHGTRTLHGPITPIPTSGVITGGNTDTIADLGSVGGIFESPDGIGAPIISNSIPTKQQINQQYDLASQPAVKLFVATEGWVRVARSAMQDAGFDSGSDPKALSLFADGNEVPILVDDGGDGRFDANDSIAFYGTGIDTPSTGAHAYWLVSNKGKRSRIASAGVTSPVSTAPGDFAYTDQRIERTVYLAALPNIGDREAFFGSIISSWPVTESVSVGGVNSVASSNAALDLIIQGATDGTHTVAVQWNGNSLGTVALTGQQRLTTTLQIPASSIIAGANTLTLTALGGDADFSVIESVRLTYPHSYIADHDALKCTAPGSSSVTVGGFTVPNITVVDVSDPVNPTLLTAKIGRSGAAYTASFVAPPGASRTILAVGENRVASPAQIAPSLPSSWHDGKNAAQLVIIANRAFMNAAAPLKALRDSQGVSTLVIDVQDLYDEFGFGHRGPKPIRDFLLASRSWRVPPRYAILLGDASFDPRNYLGVGAFDFVPTRMLPTSLLQTASEDWFADFSDTGTPAIAIGRLPARTPADASAMIAKIVNRNAASNTVLLISDGADSDFDFTAAAAALVPLVPATYTVEQHDVTRTSDPHGDVVAAMNRGALLASYIGHGSIEIWGNWVYGTDDAMAATNRAQPFVVAMECLNGFFHDLYTTSLAEGLMTDPTGGAVAVWASSGLTLPEPQNVMQRELFRQLFGSTTVTIGDAVLRAKAATNDIDVRRTWILFGDPSMRLR